MNGPVSKALPLLVYSWPKNSSQLRTRYLLSKIDNHMRLHLRMGLVAQRVAGLYVHPHSSVSLLSFLFKGSATLQGCHFAHSCPQSLHHQGTTNIPLNVLMKRRNARIRQMWEYSQVSSMREFDKPGDQQDVITRQFALLKLQLRGLSDLSTQPIDVSTTVQWYTCWMERRGPHTCNDGLRRVWPARKRWRPAYALKSADMSAESMVVRVGSLM